MIQIEGNPALIILAFCLLILAMVMMYFSIKWENRVMKEKPEDDATFGEGF